MLLFAGFGWGKPVHVNPVKYTRKITMEKGEAIVSIAGPLTNIVLALLLAILYGAIIKFASVAFLWSSVGKIIQGILASAISINIGLGVFNLIPLPPLDGSKIIMPFLPYQAKQWFRNNEQIFYIIFVAIWITGIASIMIEPPIIWITNGIMSLTKIIFGF